LVFSGVSVNNDDFYIVSDYCAGGSLDKHFGRGDISDSLKEKLTMQVALGLNHLHAQNIVHRDIAARFVRITFRLWYPAPNVLAFRNILLTSSFDAKLSDFGMSRALTENSDQGTTMQNFGPLKYMAVESLRDRTYSTASDVWTFGILAVELFSERPPHENLDLVDCAVKIRDDGLTPEIPSNMPKYLINICKRCWTADPKERPTMKEIVDTLKREISV
jgi:serine/threonine protein kinase